MISVPEQLSRTAARVGGERWLGELPALLNHLEQAWSITCGRPLAGGFEAYVVEATTTEGRAVVLKILVPWSRNPAINEITALRLAGGNGCVALLRDDLDARALLLERLGPSLFELGVPIARRHEILCETVERVWRPAPGCGLPTGVDRARSLATFITETWEKVDRPCSERAIEHAVACARRREMAHDDERAVLVHGDVHQLNALKAGAEFKLIDPDGALAEAEYDLGTLMRGDPVELLEADPRERARWLATRTGLDGTAIWEWGVIERVSTALRCEELDVQPLGRQTLTAVEAVAGVDMA